MSTTNLYVELIVIGLGAFTWVALLVAAALGVPRPVIEGLSHEGALALPALAAVYLLGIVTDRLADQLFHGTLGTRLRNSYRRDPNARAAPPDGQDKYHEDRALVLSAGGKFAELYDYSRSRQRICRGWALNAVAIIAALQFAYYRDLHWLSRDVVVGASWWLIALAGGCLYAWWSMMRTELARIAEQARTLRR